MDRLTGNREETASHLDRQKDRQIDKQTDGGRDRRTYIHVVYEHTGTHRPTHI